MKILTALSAIACLAFASCGVPVDIVYSTLDSDGNTISGAYSSKSGLAVEYHAK